MSKDPARPENGTPAAPPPIDTGSPIRTAAPPPQTAFEAQAQRVPRADEVFTQ